MRTLTVMWDGTQLKDYKLEDPYPIMDFEYLDKTEKDLKNYLIISAISFAFFFLRSVFF
jgi:hypothetical protein